MPNVEICVKSPEAEALAAELVSELGRPDGVNLKRLPSRGIDVVTVITVASATMVTADILIRWISTVRSRKRPAVIDIIVNGKPVQLEMLGHKDLARHFPK